MLKHNIKTIQKDILFIFLHLREKSDGFIKANKGHLREQHFSSCDKAEDDLEGWNVDAGGRIVRVDDGVAKVVIANAGGRWSEVILRPMAQKRFIP